MYVPLFCQPCKENIYYHHPGNTRVISNCYRESAGGEATLAREAFSQQP